MPHQCNGVTLNIFPVNPENILTLTSPVSTLRRNNRTGMSAAVVVTGAAAAAALYPQPLHQHAALGAAASSSVIRPTSILAPSATYHVQSYPLAGDLLFKPSAPGSIAYIRQRHLDMASAAGNNNNAASGGLVPPSRTSSYSSHQHLAASAAISSRSGSANFNQNPAPHTRVEDSSRVLDMYELLDILGEGSFGVVKLARRTSDGSLCACKIIAKEKTGSQQMRMIEREVQILRQVNHPHLIHLLEVIETSKNSSGGPGKMYLYMEYCGGGDLKELLAKKKFEEFEAKIVMHRLASAITYLHKRDIVHRDLKLENILLKDNPPEDPEDKLNIKVTDFGLSCLKGGIDHENMLQDFCGTPLYMAPEIIDSKSYSALCDVWAMGVIAFHLLVGYPPFQVSQSEQNLYDKIRVANIKERLKTDPDWTDISEPAKKCVGGMLTNDPAHRMSAGETLDHYWFTGQPESPNCNVLELMKLVHKEQQILKNGEQGEGGNPEAATETTGGGAPMENNNTSSREGSANSKREGSANSKSSSSGPRRSSCPANNNNNLAKTARKKNSEGSVPSIQNRTGHNPSRLPPKASVSSSSTKKTRSPNEPRTTAAATTKITNRSPGDTAGTTTTGGRPVKATTPTAPRSSPSLHPPSRIAGGVHAKPGVKTTATKTMVTGSTTKTAASGGTYNRTVNSTKPAANGGSSNSGSNTVPGSRKKIVR